jgi:hypothetical protein
MIFFRTKDSGAPRRVLEEGCNVRMRLVWCGKHQAGNWGIAFTPISFNGLIEVYSILSN